MSSGNAPFVVLSLVLSLLAVTACEDAEPSADSVEAPASDEAPSTDSPEP
ncbi:MAG: hypothetical protein JRH11_03900, partial [Deltaproteobacteria bacterium]|nr:hypothetical protein [Deltaproteobacteria bacterium]